MFLHLPVVIAAAISTIAVSEAAPSFDIARECRLESESTETFDRCSKDETDALRQVQIEWSQFAAEDAASCIVTARIGGFASYVELLTCLESRKEIRDSENKAGGAPSKTGVPSTSGDK